MSWPTAIVLDLDGTLVDSLPDIWDALGILLERHDLPRHDAATVRTMIGKGVENLVIRAFEARGVDVRGPGLDGLVRAYLDLYEPRATRDTRLFPHVAETVERFSAAGLRLAVCTNKPTAVSREMVAAFGLSRFIPTVVGGDFGPARKPDPALILATLDLMGADAADAVMVGDSGSDIEAARRAGMPVVAVDYGYTDVPVRDLGPNAVIGDFSQLPDALKRLWSER